MSLGPIYVTETNQIAALVKEVRASQGLTQDELAGLSGTGIRFIVDLEKGKATAQIQKVLDVLKVLGISVKLEK